jgi:hypothetical protein
LEAGKAVDWAYFRWVLHQPWDAWAADINTGTDIIDIAFSRDDSMMASAGTDKTVLIWHGGSFGAYLRCGTGFSAD